MQVKKEVTQATASEKTLWPNFQQLHHSGYPDIDK